VDIVQTFFHDSTLFGVTAARLAGVKRTVSCRRDLGFWHESGTRRMLHLVNRITHRILVNSPAVKDAVVTLEGVVPDKVDVIPNGIDTHLVDVTAPAPLHREFPAIRPGDRVVGMVANLNREVKRVDVLVRAACEVRKRLPKARFLVIGGGRLEGGLRCLTGELGLEDAFTLAGARDSALAYIKAFDIGVLTSDSEGFPNVILEYMAAGVPVVATDVGGNREVVRDSSLGVLVPPGDHAALASSIVGLLEDDARRAETGARGQELVRSTFSWDRKIEEMSTYYEGLLEGP
jgi:glycosyltransferase involved in cell wall biosynthesis